MGLVPDRDAAEYDEPVVMGLDGGDGCGDESIVDGCRHDNADSDDQKDRGLHDHRKNEDPLRQRIPADPDQ